MKIQALAATALLAFAACQSHKPPQAVTPPIPPAQPQTLSEPKIDPRTHAVLWFATSGESDACYLQGYGAASMELIKRGRAKGKQAIVTDLDETAISNAASSALEVLEHRDYTDEAWERWVEREAATALPGAVDFFKLADQMGYRICYLSNRSTKSAAHTLKSIQGLGFPQADTAHLRLKSGPSNKEPRRQALRAQGYEIVMLLGDNLADFIDLPSSSTEQRRADSVRAHRADWGRKYIVFPNPMYGNWYDALVPRTTPNAKRDSVTRTRLVNLAKTANPESK